MAPYDPTDRDGAAPLRGEPGSAPPRLVAGTMTGTSIDGDIDVALVAVHGHGLDMRAPLVHWRSLELGPVADALRLLAREERMTAREIAETARRFGERHADALELLLAEANARADLAVLHGQTVYHAPPLTWQLIDPWPVAVRLGCAVRYDLRGASVASGGEGAPITPLADFILFADDTGRKTVLNLGGFANATLLPRRSDGPDTIAGLDLCACNHLLDRVARTRLGRGFDEDGRAAARGAPDHARADEILRALDAIAERASAAVSGNTPTSGATRARHRSLGTGDEAAAAVSVTDDLSAEDACATVTDALARAIARRLETAGHFFGQTIVLAGGGARHRVLREAIARHARSPVETSLEHVGIPVSMREASAMAVLGALADDGVRYSLPAAAGAPSRVPESALIGRAARPAVSL
jgi:anhydro-N-acetylmuramic acid kinase